MEKKLHEQLQEIMRAEAEKAGMTELELFDAICDLGEQELYGFVLPREYDPSTDESIPKLA
jgi:hypothetical protein